MNLMHVRDLGQAQDCAGNVLYEIFQRLDGVLARPQATRARMKHHVQDDATDLGVDPPLTKLQATALMKERGAKVEDEGGGDAPPSPCAPQDDRDPFPTPRRPPPPSLPAPDVCKEFYSGSGKRSQQRAREPYRQHFAFFVSLARDRVVPGQPWRPKQKHHATHHVFDRTGHPPQFQNYGDESAIGWAQQRRRDRARCRCSLVL